MAAEVTMPRLSDSMEEGVVVAWLKQPGDEISVGDELVEIETDKANMVYEADVAGTVLELVVAEGDAAAVGAVIARVGEPGEAGGSSNGGPTAPADAASASAPAAATPPAAVAPPPVAEPAAGGRVKASPLARRTARDRGVELAGIAGSGPGGRIVKADVENAAPPASKRSSPPAGPQVGRASEAPAAGAPAPDAVQSARGEVEVVEPTKLQAAVARRMSESKATAPHFYLESRIDMTRAVEGRKQLKASATEVVPSLNDMVVKACALALREFPKANGAYRDRRFELYGRVNVGVAVAAQNALIVPTVFDADRKGLRQIAVETRALADKVRAGQITPPEISGGTFTVSNLGMYGISNFKAVINPPQAAILAVGEVAETPVVREGGYATAHLMSVTLACDHRILYGAEAAEFLARIRALLEEPLALAI